MTDSNSASPSGPGSFTASALSASLSVNKLDESVRWYTETLGFAVDRKMERDGKLVAVAIKAGNVQLLLNQDDGAKGERKKGEGFSMMLTTNDVDGAAARIKAAGGTLDSEPADMPWGARVFRVVDPNGFRFAIST